MDVVQQSPFLPLARALYEAIAALNENDQPATQQSIVDFLFEAYQYVHLPKLNVIHGCLGILIKEEKIYHNGTGYFISSPPGPPSGDKPKVSPTNDTDTSPLSKEPVAPKGESTEENTTQQEDTREVENRCTECGGSNVKGNTDGGGEQSMDTQVVEPITRRSRKKVSTGKTDPDKKLISSLSKESNPKEEIKIPEFTDKEKKGATREKRRHQKDSNSNSTTSETTSSTSERTHKKNPKDKQNQEGKKPKRNVFSQMSCFISKTFSTADVFYEQANAAVPSEETAPISLDAQIIEHKAGVASDDTSVFDARKLTRKEDYKDENEVKIADDFHDLRLSVTRSRSFVQPSKKRQDYPTGSISFAASTVRASPRVEKTSGDVARLDERRAHVSQTDSVCRNVIFRRSMPPLSSSGTFPVGIVRPLTNSHTTDYRTVSRSNSTKAESSRKSSASGTPSSTPKMKDKAVGHAGRSAQLKDTPKRIGSHVSFRTMENQIYHVETPLKQLPCSNAKHQTPSSSKVRETAPTKTRYFGPGPHFVPGNSQKKASARSTAPFQACESTHAPSTPAMCYENNCKFTGENTEHCKCYFHGDELNTAHEQMSGLLDSQDICLEEVSSSDCSDLYHVAGERYLEVKPFPPRQFVDGESRFDESLTFIGII